MLVASDSTAELGDHLHRNNMMVRPQGPPIDHTFRMSGRTLPEMQQFMEVFDLFLNR